MWSEVSFSDIENDRYRWLGDIITVDNVLSGVRVLEVAAWTSVPSGGAVLAEWGAEPDAPEHGQHTEEVLMEAGIEWEAIKKLKESGAIL